MPSQLVPPLQTLKPQMYRSLPATTTLEPSSNNEKEVTPNEEIVNESCPFDVIGNGPCSDVDKLGWLMSQVIGGEAEFDSPFGRRRITYSDHTATGRFLRCVEDFLQEELLPFYGNTHTFDSHVGLHTTKLMQQASSYVKACMGGGPNDVLLFCGSGSTHAIKRLQEVMGLAIPSILRSTVIGSLVPTERWVVFTGPFEHHSNLLSWRESLAEVVEIGLDEMGRIDVDTLKWALRCPEFLGRPKLGSFSACSNVTGRKADTRALARLLHDHGAYACFDFACSGPYVDIEMRSRRSDGYDAVFLSPHKFLGGPGSSGVLLMSENLYRLRGAPPSTSGGGTVLYVNGFQEEDTVYCDDVEEREDAGTPAIMQKIRAAAAFRVKEYIGQELIQKREAWLMGRAMEKLDMEPRIRILGRDSWASRHQPIISFLAYPVAESKKHLHCRFVTKLLNDLLGIQARGGCACAGPYGHALLSIGRPQAAAIRAAVQLGYGGVKPGWTRISFSYYTSDDEMEFVVEAVLFVARFGHRFLPLYSFNWRTGEWSFAVAEGYMDNRRSLMRQKIEEQMMAGQFPSKYEDYMMQARVLAEALPDPSSNYRGTQPPEEVDPQLLNFIF